MAKETINKIRCTKCGKSKAPSTNFYLSRSNRYANNLGRLDVCKLCFYEEFEVLMKRYNNDFVKAMYHLCMNYDIYFCKSLCESSASVETVTNTPIGILKEYMKTLNSFPVYNGLTSINSDHIYLGDDNMSTNSELSEDDKKSKNNYNLKGDKYEEIILTNEIRRRWGSEYTDEQCIRLEEYYRHYFSNYNHENDAGKLDILEEVCTYRLIKAQAVREKDNKTIRDFTEIISKRMADAGLKPCQQRVSGEADEDVFGMQLYIYEKKKPVPKALKEYLDVDGFWKYILKHMIKPLSVAMGMAKGEYDIEDGDKNIELSPKMQEALEDSKNE